MQQAVGDRAGQQVAHRPAMARTDDNGIGFLGLGEAVQALRGRARRHDARLDAVARRNRIDQHVLRVRAQDLLTLGRARHVGESFGTTPTTSSSALVISEKSTARASPSAA